MVCFTELEVKHLCEKYRICFADAKRWYIGLFMSVLKLLEGLSVPVDTSGFNNDIATIRNRDDILTLLIHLGYLTYDESEETVRIPNEEIRMAFTKSVREMKK